MRAALFRFGLGAVVVPIFLTGCAGHASTERRVAKRANENAARAGATDWLQLLDDRDYSKAYDREPARLRTGGARSGFVRAMKLHRSPLGPALKRTFIGAAAAQKLPGGPDGNYESVLFRTSFENKQTAAERVILTRERGAWRTVDYRVY